MWPVYRFCCKILPFNQKSLGYSTQLVQHENNLCNSCKSVCTQAAVMEAAALGSWDFLSGILLLVSVVFLIGLCGGCQRSAHRTSIPEPFMDDYIQQGPNLQGFRVLRPACTALPVSSRSSGNSTHLPFPSSPKPERIRPSSYSPPADGGSLHSYDNPASQIGDYINDSEEENEKGEGYIMVLPGPPVAMPIGRSEQSLVSSQSSERGDYINVPVPEEEDRSDTSSQNYINVQAGGEHCKLSPGISLDNMESDDNSISDYVNTEFIKHTTCQ
ncbi:uncharacterized protein LOC133115428 [Conger conger]|nr:uncharacterized protein LOC133115428 [Conger conger]